MYGGSLSIDGTIIWGFHGDHGTKMSVIMISAVVTGNIRPLSSREKWADSAIISQSDHFPYETLDSCQLTLKKPSAAS